MRHIAQLHSVTPDEEREGGQQRDRERERKKKVSIKFRVLNVSKEEIYVFFKSHDRRDVKEQHRSAHGMSTLSTK